MIGSSIAPDRAATSALGDEPWYQKVLGGIARGVSLLQKMDARGELAALRRIDPARPNEPVLFRILARAAPEELTAHFERVRRYAVIAKFMALKPEALQRGGLGKSLHAAGFSEHRLLALLNARGATLSDLVRRAARRLALAPEVPALPYMEMATLILLDGNASYELATERIRLRIAADYQRAEWKAGSSDAN
jgi:hypothetical protein